LISLLGQKGTVETVPDLQNYTFKFLTEPGLFAFGDNREAIAEQRRS